MIKRIWDRLRVPPRAGKQHLAWVLLLGIVWLTALYNRQHVMALHCTVEENCAWESVIWPDRLLDGRRNVVADHWSDRTQNTAGTIGGLTPALAYFGLTALGRLTPASAAAAAGTDLLIFFHATFLNGTLNEFIRLGVQRPRPFVYENPAREAGNPAHYTSFYSGHTSFAAVAMMSLVCALAGRGFRRRWIALAAAGWLSLTVATGVLRVMAGVHFMTDVVVGGIAGSVIAIGAALLHRGRKNHHA